METKYEQREKESGVTQVQGDEIKVYSYEEAIGLAGTGWYHVGLLATLSLSLLAMALDMFSFALVVTLSSCDLQLDQTSRSVLVSMPFVGPIIMAYAWGYISDTRGRRATLLVAMAVSFVFSVVSAFSPHWIMLAVCRLVSTCFCSCAQSSAYTLLGESSPERVKGRYMLVMTSVIHLNLCIYYPLAYASLATDISANLGFITFTPWRLLILILALPLGLATALLFCFFESPKFLLNAGREAEALELLKKICRRNGKDVACYPVQKLIVLEEKKLLSSDSPLLQSLWDQTIPVFTPPTLWKTLVLYYLIFAIYSSTSSLLVWLPFLAESISMGFSSGSANRSQGLCANDQPSAKLISLKYTTTFLFKNGSFVFQDSCTVSIEPPIVVSAVVAGLFYCVLTALTSQFAARKKMLMILMFLLSCASGVGTAVIKSNMAGVVLYFGIMLSCLNMGIAFSYCVDLYPTSFRGMASCLGVMIARLSSIAGINITGPFISAHCLETFGYGFTLLMLSAALIALFLPPDKLSKM